jgi:hypothetical protein
MRSIAFGQPSSIDSVTISRDQQKQCIVWHHEGVVKDSIIVAKDSIIVVQREFIQYTDTLITDYDLKLKTSYNRLDKMKKKRRNAWIFGGIGTVGAFIFGFLLSP